MGDKKNLVIEDDADVRLGYQVVLKANNYATCFAADAMCAISEARKQQPDLIILDLGLPAGDGFVVLERLRANTQISHDPRHRGVRPPPFRNKERALRLDEALVGSDPVLIWGGAVFATVPDCFGCDSVAPNLI